MKTMKMTVQEAKKHGFTHKGYIYGIIRIYAIYYEGEEQPEIVEKNMFYGFLLDIFTFVDVNLIQSEGFYLELKPIDEDEGVHAFSTLFWTLIMLLITWIALKLR